MAVEWLPVTSGPATAEERRRAGRFEGASPNLIPLMRGSCTLIEGKGGSDLVRFGSDQSAPARGIIIGVIISAVIWVVLFLAIQAVL
jgi:hypothetical protein